MIHLNITIVTVKKKFHCGGGSLKTLPELVPGMAGGNIDTADREDISVREDGSDIVDGSVHDSTDSTGCSGQEAGGAVDSSDDSTVDGSSDSTVNGRASGGGVSIMSS